MSARRRCERLVAVAVAVSALAACSSSDGEAEGDLATGTEVNSTSSSESVSPTASTVPVTVGTAPPTTLPDCPVDAADETPAWPHVVPADVVAISFGIEDLTYTVTGVTNRPEAVIVDAMNEAFADFDAEEPTGEATDISVAFTAERGNATLQMSDDDVDGCWDVEMIAEYAQSPTLGTAPTVGAEDESATLGFDDAFTEAVRVGSGEIITGRGTFTLAVTACSTNPVEVDAIAVEGLLELRSVDDRVEARWTYADEVEIASDDARVLGLSESGGTVVVDGENDDGPESLIIDFLCTD